MMKIKVNENDHIQGSLDAPVVMFEYADFQCPYCKQAFYILREAKRLLNDDLCLVFRNFPLTDLHPYALRAAIAAEAASAQGKFWEMHDEIFANQERLQDEYLLAYARKIGLDIKQFEEDFSKDRYLQKVNNDFETGSATGVDGTPTFFINGELYEGNWMSPGFIKQLESLVYS